LKFDFFRILERDRKGSVLLPTFELPPKTFETIVNADFGSPSKEVARD
jgi:hypothetical protein